MPSIKISIDAAEVYPNLLPDLYEQMTDERVDGLNEDDVLTVNLSDLFNDARQYFAEDALAAAERLIDQHLPLHRGNFESVEIAVIEQAAGNHSEMVFAPTAVHTRGAVPRAAA